VKILAPISAAVVVASGLGLTACSSPSAFDDPCHVLTRTIVGQTTGVTMLRADFDEDLSNDHQRVCAWRPAAGGYPVVQVFVSEGGDQVAAQRADAESGLGASTDVTIDGATDAYVVGKGSIVGMVVDDTFVQVALIEPTGEDVSAVTITLAKQAAARV
jgi:ABC-type glycerol-3-phosphate transport system substrate-binding protein